jgi:hypothetical protein
MYCKYIWLEHQPHRRLYLSTASTMNTLSPACCTQEYFRRMASSCTWHIERRDLALPPPASFPAGHNLDLAPRLGASSDVPFVLPQIPYQSLEIPYDHQVPNRLNKIPHNA